MFKKNKLNENVETDEYNIIIDKRINFNFNEVHIFIKNYLIKE